MTLLLQALYPVTDRFNSLGHSVQAAFDAYRDWIFLREPLRTTFIADAVAGAAVRRAECAVGGRVLRAQVRCSRCATSPTARARSLCRPVRQAARAGGQRRSGFLVQSFNEMTRNLASARDSALQSRHMLEGQRAYLETIARAPVLRAC